jgi:hypothetical protein
MGRISLIPFLSFCLLVRSVTSPRFLELSHFLEPIDFGGINLSMGMSLGQKRNVITLGGVTYDLKSDAIAVALGIDLLSFAVCALLSMHSTEVGK